MTDTGWERSGRRPWLLATARRVSADALRARRKDLLRHADLDDLTIGVPDGTEEADRRHDLVAALTTLPPLDREALPLITWHDLTHAEAAGVMDCSTPAFGVRVHRARRRMRGLLQTPVLTEPSTPTLLEAQP